MKSSRPAQLLAFALASLFAFPASPAFAADAKTDSLNAANDELATLKNKYADNHPRVIEQHQRIAQLQSRIDNEKPAATPRNAIIRTEVRILMPKTGGGVELIAAPTLITQSGQEASLSIGAFGIVLNSSVDEQNNITSSMELSMNTADGKPGEKAKLPLIKTRPGERSTIPVPGGILVEILATLVEPKGISVDFPGGTLAQLLTAISNSGSQPFNLIASKEALALPLPQFSLRNVGPRDLALALDQLLVGYIVDFPTEKTERDGLPVFTLRATEPVHQQNAETKQRPSRATSYPITQLLQAQMPIDKVIDSINAAWTLDPANKPDDLKVKYHEGTGILLVSSRDERALALVDRMIMSLREQAEYLKYKAAQTQSPSVEQPKR
jgi:hypothetical protein